MKKTRIMSLAALAAMLSTTTAPIFAAETATGDTTVTYTANSASTADADWVVSYPKSVTLTDYNTSVSTSQPVKFELKDKFDSTKAYGGERTVDVTLDTYTNGIALEKTGTTTVPTMLIADSTGSELSGSNKKIAALDKTDHTLSGKAYFKADTLVSDLEGTYTAKITFTFTDNS